MADQRLSNRTATTDATGGQIHIIKWSGAIWQSFKITVANLFKNIVSAVFVPQVTAPTYEEGLLYYDDTKSALSYYNDQSDITVNVGQEVLIPVYNNTGSIITNGTLVYPTGTFGDKHTVGLADNRFKAKCRLVAMVTHDIANGSSGYVTRIGSVGGVNTFTYTGLLYLGINGLFTDVPPDDGAYRIQIGAVKETGVSGSITMDPYITDLTVEVTDTNGFPSDQKTGTTLSVVDLTRTFSITPTGALFHFYELGVKYEFSSVQSIVFADTEGSHWFYFNGGVLTTLANPTGAQKLDIILTKCFIGIIYWNATLNVHEFDIFEERHGISMSPATHAYLHITRGAQFGSGYGLGDFVPDGNGSLDTHAQFSSAAGTYYDEDIQHIFDGTNVGDTITVGYLDGALGLLKTEDTTGFAVSHAPGGTLYYNEWTGAIWQRTEIGNNDFVLYHIFAINGVSKQIVSIMGQEEYGNISAARAGATTEISNILSAFDLQEMVPIGTIIFKCNTAYTNSVKAAIVSVETGVYYVDWRTTELSQGVAPSSHSNLTNLDLAAAGVTWGHINDGAQTIAGVKTFTSSPVVPAPTTDLQAATKKYVDDSSEQIILIPTTQPAIVTGTPNILTIDIDSNRQAMFEPRLSVGTLSINIDFDLVISNDTNALLLSSVFSLTGTRIISFESDVLCSNPSSIGTWNDTTQELTLITGTDDIIEVQLLRYSTGSKWLLKVAEVAL